MKKLLPVLAVTAVVAIVAACAATRSSPSVEATYEAASAALREAVLSNGSVNPAPVETGNVVVILSQSDGDHRAYVQTGTGETVADAWADADDRILAGIRSSNSRTRYLKADVVTSVETTGTADVIDRLVYATPPYPFGVALDDGLETALLPQELDSLRPFTTAGFDVDYLNAYFEATGKPRVPSVRDDVLTFRTRSWLLDVETGEVTPLDASGVRPVAMTGTELEDIIATAGRYLANHISADGKFQYLVYPQALADVRDYNIVRHAGALYAMTQYAEVSGDLSVKTQIDAGIAFLENAIVRDADGGAYVRNTDAPTCAIGTSGIVCLALENYASVFGSDEHDGLLRAVADGIVNNQRPDGHVPHVLSEDMTVAKDYQTVFYDGEACFGLFRAYAATGDERYRAAALRYCDYMVENDYWQHRDHWLAYSMNEATKLLPTEARYYGLAFRNFYENVDDLGRARSNGPTRLELLTSTLELYERAVANGVEIPPEFDVATFRDAIEDQARIQLNCYLFPERAMYSAACDKVAGAFYDNGDATWEIRIDTVQHHLSGYYHYMRLLDAAHD